MKLAPETGKAPASQKPNDRIEKLEKEVANLNMAIRISQMLLKQLMEQMQPVQQELRATTGMVNDFQYRTLALQSTLGVDLVALKTKADELKLNDWNQASDKDDEANGFTKADTATSSEDTVIISSVVAGKDDAGIFRSKVVLGQTGNQQLVEGLLNKAVGTVVDVKIGEDVHTVTLLAVRVAPVAVVEAPTTEETQH